MSSAAGTLLPATSAMTDHQPSRDPQDGIEGIVIIAATEFCGRVAKACSRPRLSGRLRRHEPGLNLSRDFEVAFHRDLVRQFQREQKQEDKGGVTSKFRSKAKFCPTEA